MNNLILDVDIGNSRTKWNLRGDNSLDTGVVLNANLDAVFELMANEKIIRVRACCVSSEELQEKFSRLCWSSWGLVPEYACSSESYSGLKNGYKPPESLGVDRWLSAVGAWGISPGVACLIIDAGSALTIDTVSDEGVFLGGYIIPGLYLMQKSLVGGADRINCSLEWMVKDDCADIPSTTKDAVQRGAAFALKATAKMAIDDFKARWPHGKVRITGGSGFDLSVELGMDDFYHPDLVLVGLASALL